MFIHNSSWAWAIGIVDVMDQAGWKLIENETLWFYQTHGIQTLDSLKQWLIGKGLPDTY